MGEQQPVLHLGVFGVFNAQERMTLAQQVHSCLEAGFRWQISHTLDADALFLAGGSCHLHGPAANNQLQLSIDLGQDKTHQLALAHWHTPTLIGLPAQEQVQALPAPFLPVDGWQQRSQGLHDTLRSVTQAMRYERVLYALGAGMLRERDLVFSELGQKNAHVLHIYDLHHLAAVLIPEKQQILFSTEADSVRSHAWGWCRRPAAAAESKPPHFLKVSFEEALWSYAMRTPYLQSPETFVQEGLAFARRPDVRPSMLRQRHAVLFQRLNSNSDAIFQKLQNPAHRVQLPEVLQRDLYALHLCGCLLAHVPQNLMHGVVGRIRDWTHGLVLQRQAQKRPALPARQLASTFSLSLMPPAQNSRQGRSQLQVSGWF